jgi:transposase
LDDARLSRYCVFVNSGGWDERSRELFSYVDLEARVRRDHPLRAIRVLVSEALAALEREFAALHSPIGRPSIPPKKLLREW